MTANTDRETKFKPALGTSDAVQPGPNVEPADPTAGERRSSGQIDLAPPDRQQPQLDLPKISSRKIGVAVVGLGELAIEEILPSFGQAERVHLAALVSGHRDKAEHLAQAYDVPSDAIYAYDTFDRIASDHRIDAVYIVLPNSMHAEFTIRALKAGKHVLCEKPMAGNLAEAQQMIDTAASAGRKLMIAYRLHYEPFNQTAAELCRSAVIGKIRTISATNTQKTEAPNIRLSARLGGGPVGDVGIYCINAGRYLTGEEPAEVMAYAVRSNEPRFAEVPQSVAFTLRYPSGVLAHCDCGFDTAVSRHFRVHGTEGYVDLENAFAYRGQRLRVKRKSGTAASAEEVLLEIEPENHFAAEMDHFASAIIDHHPVRTPGEMGLADMRIIAAIEQAAASGQSVGFE